MILEFATFPVKAETNTEFERRIAMKTEKIDWKESTCPICGKKFIPAPEHAYRRRVRTSLRYICSYHCVLEYDKNKIDRRYARSSKSLRSVKADAPEAL